MTDWICSLHLGLIIPWACIVKIVASPCIIAKGTIINLVKRSNFLRPRSPDLVHRESTGTTSVDNNWTIIEAVMYGETPKAKIENLPILPPPKVASNWKN